MSSMKTAISIEAGLFKRVERVSQKMGISRSEFFCRAARYMLEQGENENIVRELNICYGEHPHDTNEKKELDESKLKAREILEEW